MTELLVALVGVLNIAVGALAWQLRRNGKNNSTNNSHLHDAVKLLYSIDGKLDRSLDIQERILKEAEIWRGEVRQNHKEVLKELANIPKRSE